LRQSRFERVVRGTLAFLAVSLLSSSLAAAPIDDFETVDGWIAAPSDGVELHITSVPGGVSGRAMRLDYDFHGGAGYAIARKPLKLSLPDDYEFTFQLRGESPRNTLEFKLLDPSGESVWWLNQRNFEFPEAWKRMRIKKRHLEFAWGPSGGAPLKETSALEIVITASSGGKGSVFIDDLEFVERAARPAEFPQPVASASSTRKPLALALDRQRATQWESATARDESFTLDFGMPREFGGVTIEWGEHFHATDYDVQTSDDGVHWEMLQSIEGSGGNVDRLFLPDADARFLRLQMKRGPGDRFAIREIRVEPLAFSQSKNAFFASIAAGETRGMYPRYFSNQQVYWAVVGAPNEEREALLNEDGALEVDRASFSIEPFLYSAGQLLSWYDACRTQSLGGAYLPIPTVEWTLPDLKLSVTAYAEGKTIYARYRVSNQASAPRSVDLLLAVRPFQVNPPWQFLNVQGGVSEIHDITWANQVVTAEGKQVISVTPADGFGATTFAGGDITESLMFARLPKETTVHDRFGAASAAMHYRLSIPANAYRDVYIALPEDGSSTRPDVEGAKQALLTSTRDWRERLDRFTLELGGDEGKLVSRVVKSNVGYILVNQDGPSIQPGSRSYDRSWIRDGSLTSSALLRVGLHEPVKAFAEWFAPYQFPSGKVPCCVDSRGADPVPENDSHGQLIYLIAEYYRHTHDRAFVERLWPHVQRAVGYIDTLTKQRMTPEYQAPDKRAYYGLVPESISHEGYSAKPMHSYWDDFFTLRGLRDAAFLAVVLDAPERVQYEAMTSTFRTNFMASIALARKEHGIDFIPGSVELGDFDATSTTVALAPGEEIAALDRKALEATFERYYQESMKRISNPVWEAYTPYETRAIGSMIRLGWRDRAHEMLAFFLHDLRPAAWNQWAEVVFRDPATPKFIGDMPHTWVGSDFIRSVLDMLAYEEDGALIVGAGVPESWTQEEGVVMRGLHTHFGTFDLTMKSSDSLLRMEMRGTAAPPAGFVLRPPHAWKRATVNGKRVKGELRVKTLPALVALAW
jgi:hypothetical protein